MSPIIDSSSASHVLSWKTGVSFPFTSTSVTPSLLSFLADTVFSPLRRAATLSTPSCSWLYTWLPLPPLAVCAPRQRISLGVLVRGLQQLSSAVLRRLPPPVTVQGVLYVVHVRLRRDWVVPLRLTSVRLPLTEWDSSIPQKSPVRCFQSS